MKNGVLAVLCFILTAFAGAQQNSLVTSNTTKTVQLRAKVLASWKPQQLPGEALPVGIDPHFVLTMRVESVVPPISEIQSGTIINFAIHSPTLVFLGDPQMNKTYEFMLSREMNDGRAKLLSLRVEEARGLEQETQVLGYWIDPSTGLMWAGKDNGRDVTWKKAMNYCRDLRLAGYSDWRLASLEELEDIYDKDAKAPGLMGPSGKGTASTWNVKGNIFLTGNQWTSTQRLEDGGKPSGYAWRFDFNMGQSFGGDELSFYSNKRGLCVRGSGEVMH